MPTLTVITHPLVSDKTARLRNEATVPGEFRRLCHEITLLSAYEALRDLPVQPATVRTPLADAEVRVLAQPGVAVVGILRAGLVMVEAILDLVPQARVGHLGLYRDPESLQPVEYYVKLPVDIAEREVLVVDPMLATGGSAAHAIDVLKREGCRRIRLLSIMGAPEGVRAVHDRHPEVPITLAALDDHLNDHGYIVPGLGDAGDRIYGTR